MKKPVFLVTSLIAGSALVLAQSGSQDRRAGTPGHPDWKGQTLQTSPAPANASVGGLDPMDIIKKPLSDQWTSYSGDMSGKRFSLLKHVNTNTVKNLSLKWVTSLTTGCGPTGRAAAPAGGGGFGGGRGGFGGGGPAAPINVGGLGNGDANNCGPARLGGGILFVDGIIYASSPSNVYAIDARDGTLLWHYYWKTRGGTSLQTRGLGMWRNYIYFELNDDWVVCLDAKTGKEIWKHEIAPFDQQYFSSNAPMVIKDHVLVGTGNDLDAPAFLKSLDPRTGEVQWILYSTPQNPGEPGLETWASLDAARHGNGATWIPGSYDPETNLYLYGTGNPTPAYTQGRGDGDNLFTSSLLAVDVDTGKMKWYFQTSPHDTHDWDSTQTPILADMPFNGRTRKLVMTATRNGYFFVLDRTTGERLLTSKLGLVNNWAIGLDAKGQPKRNPNKDATIAGSLVNGDVLNYPPPTFSPDTGLFYVHEQNSMRISYLMEPDPRGSMGLGGTSGGGNLNWGTYIVAVDYKTGKITWRKELNGGSVGLLSTAGGLLFLSNGPNVEAWDAATGKGLWYSQIGGLSSPAETFMLDGKQHMLFTGGSGLYLFVLN
ncbi:MAG TPA: PQQ-binding-like beta-propeller repeat protein [Vicinamibacterales bacterium]|nr:PQQ-binding-like beta-propeller repeat protein [Vicinamibacterales bacterium]